MGMAFVARTDGMKAMSVVIRPFMVFKLAFPSLFRSLA